MLSNRASGYTDAHNFGRRGPPGPGGASPPAPPVTRLAFGPRQRLHDRARDEERDKGGELPDEDRPIEVDRGPPLGLAVLDHPRSGGPRAHAKADAPVPGSIAAAAATTQHAGGGDDRDSVLLVGVAVYAADGNDLFRLADRVKCVHRKTSPRSSPRRYAPSLWLETRGARSRAPCPRAPRRPRGGGRFRSPSSAPRRRYARA